MKISTQDYWTTLMGSKHGMTGKIPKKGRKIFIVYQGESMVLKCYTEHDTLTFNLEDTNGNFNTEELNFGTSRSKYFALEITADKKFKLKQPWFKQILERNTYKLINYLKTEEILLYVVVHKSLNNSGLLLSSHGKSNSSSRTVQKFMDIRCFSLYERSNKVCSCTRNKWGRKNRGS